jgi:DnaK suppressor protein
VNIEHLKQRLLAREKELTEEISRFRNEARECRSAEVGDPADRAVSSEEKDIALEETSLAADTLKQVRAALKRIDDPTYGQCVDCGRPIEPGRLEAVPWTPYCLDDQRKHDLAASEHVNVASTT